jgi:hypothetical protein
MRTDRVMMRPWLLLALLAGACAHYEYPYARAQLAVDSRAHAADALVHYLRQPNADPHACDPRQRPAVAQVDPDVVEAVAEGLGDGRIRGEVAETCLSLALAALPPAELAPALASLSRVCLKVARLPGGAAPLAVLERLLVLSKPASDHPEALAELARDLANELGHGALPPATQASAQRMVAAYELSQGRWQGQPVTPERIAAERDEGSLAMFAARLPGAPLRRRAQQELVRRRALASAFAEVREHADEVVARVLASGRNATALSATVRRAWFEPRAWQGSLVVRQHPLEGTATLLARARAGVDVAPRLPLRGFLWLEVEGVSQPLTVCQPASALAVDPCLAPEALGVRSPHLRLQDDGDLVLAERTSILETLPWLEREAALRLDVEVGGTHARTSLAVAFEGPEPLLFAGGGRGGRGPDVAATVEERAGHLVVRVRADGRDVTAVLAEADVPRFSVVTRGAAGSAGSDGFRGSDGSRGSSGMSGSCYGSGTSGETGGRGGRGHDGGAGGPGGAGGDVVVRVSCDATACARVEALARALFHSEGGPGGSGGRGGAGGRGGEGGSGGASTSCSETKSNYDYTTHRTSYTTTTRSVSAGMSGMRGSDGAKGNDGLGGRPGSPGHVRIELGAGASAEARDPR